MSHLIKRGKWYHFKRRIPEMFSSLYDDQEFINASLKTDSQAIASQRAQILNFELERLWHQSMTQGDVSLDDGLKNAVLQARLSGFTYRPAHDLAEQNIGKLVERLLSLKEQEQTPSQVAVLLGGHGASEYPLSHAHEDFINFEVQNLSGKNEDQIRKWKNPRLKAINNFIQVIGDKDVCEIVRGDVLAFRTWWHHRIQEDGMTANSANKDFSYLRQVLAYARDDKQKEINIGSLFERVRFTEKRSVRPPFETAFIQNSLLDPRSLGSLNDECRYFLFAIADTGARPGELVGLDNTAGEIRLDTEIPHIIIQPNDIRTLKTGQSERKIPLTGASLYAFQNLPNGFKHYRGKSDLLSSTLNKYLSENGLLPTEDHCLYSLRHSFEDRLTEVGTPDKIMAALMGHKYSRERYGKGPSLERKKHYLDQMCFHVS